MDEALKVLYQHMEYFVPVITEPMHFIGTTDSLENAAGEDGDIVIYHDNTYLYIAGNWERMDGIREFAPPATVRKIITQCRNCGAPTLHDGMCPYCGTVNVIYE